MMLADQACQQAPIRKSGVGATSFSTLEAIGGSNEFGEVHTNDTGFVDNSALGALIQYGSYFSTASPLNGGSSNNNYNRVRV